MPETIAAAANPAPLTTLTEDELLFRDTVRQFADESVRPHVKKMDEKGVFGALAASTSSSSLG